ncbi:hypothetical protein HHK36_006400 [Tetracentron sinense]|uniref:Uncharacterized protein n=1 Tax=Tetracentron sinense TaxID=13715 RepID=A0A834ZLH2_TETSI|nr:hypothetical protein HHK36_006400 [Tetracentron sinense]
MASKGRGRASGVVRVPEMEKMSLEQLKALKEQSDLEERNDASMASLYFSGMLGDADKVLVDVETSEKEIVTVENEIETAVSFGGLAQAGVVVRVEAVEVLLATSVVNGILGPEGKYGDFDYTWHMCGTEFALESQNQAGDFVSHLTPWTEVP